MTSQGRTYRAAAIGRTGRGNYGHGLDMVFVGIPQIEYVAIADENPDGLQRAGERTGVRRLYTSYEEMLHVERPDIVSIGPRWVDCHLEMVLSAAHYGCHIYLEKPMARTLAEADQMM